MGTGVSGSKMDASIMSEILLCRRPFADRLGLSAFDNVPECDCSLVSNFSSIKQVVARALQYCTTTEDLICAAKQTMTRRYSAEAARKALDHVSNPSVKVGN